jgi:aminoglycoside 3-N-acetyltransferase
MPEKDTINYAAPAPLTEDTILGDLRALGIESGDAIIVHSSLSSLGWVSGGAGALIMALERAVTPRGTLVMPAHSGDLSDPAQWENPPVPEAWWRAIRESMPAYDRQRTPTRAMGCVPELFRTWPGVLRSGHPELSFSAWGAKKRRVVRDPRPGAGFGDALGDRSPLGALYELGGKVLLLGVGYENCTCLHLAEYRSSWAGKKRERRGAPVMRRGARAWVEFEDIEYDTEDFPAIGRAFEASLGARVGKVGAAEARLADVRELVDFAARWMEENRR